MLKRLFNRNKSDSQDVRSEQALSLKPVEHINIPSQDRLYLEGILRDSGILTPDMSSDAKEERIQDLASELYNYIRQLALEKLSPDHLEPYVKMVEQNKPREEIDAFLMSKISGYSRLALQARTDFRDYYLGKEDTKDQERM